jgi:methylenetetrahydrofolate reductase (NADPH)
MLSAAEQKILAHTVHEAYMEIFPTPTIESKLDVLEPGSYVAVTCSPSKGVDVTLDMSERLAKRGFKVVPHIAAKMVRDETHLKEILKHLDDLPIVSIFVPGGDAEKPAGQYVRALDLLRAISEFDHKFTEIGVAAHPEGHPSVDNAILLEQLLKKQEYANYMVTQMCFDANTIGDWLRDIRHAGVTHRCWQLAAIFEKQQQDCGATHDVKVLPAGRLARGPRAIHCRPCLRHPGPPHILL